MPNLYVIEAQTGNGLTEPTNGVSLGSLPTLTGLSPPTPPTLAYFKSQSTLFTNLQIIPIQPGITPITVQNGTDTIGVYADAACTFQPGNALGAPTTLAGAGITSAVYVQRAAIKPN